MSNQENYDVNNVEPVTEAYVVPEETVYVEQPVVAQTVADQAVYTPQNVPAYVPQAAATSGIGAKVGIGALSAIAGGVLTWAFMHNHTPQVAAPEMPMAPVAPAAGELHDGTFYSGTFAVNPSVDLQLAVHVVNGRISEIVPDITKGASPVSDSINEDALPKLVASAIEHQDGNIDMVTDATGTSNAFHEGLQAALNQSRAGIASLPAPAPIAEGGEEHGTYPAEGEEHATADAGTPNLTRPGIEAADGPLHDGTWEGSTVEVAGADRGRYGDVMVTVTTEGGRITHIEATYPGQQEGERERSLQINEEAIPELIADAIEKQSAEVNVVTGATYTSHAFAESLQWALNEARD